MITRQSRFIWICLPVLIASLGCGESSPAALPDPAPSDTVTPEVTPGEVAQTDTTPAPPPHPGFGKRSPRSSDRVED